MDEPQGSQVVRVRQGKATTEAILKLKLLTVWKRTQIGMDWEFGADMYRLLCLKEMTNKELL